MWSKEVGTLQRELPKVQRELQQRLQNEWLQQRQLKL